MNCQSNRECPPDTICDNGTCVLHKHNEFGYIYDWLDEYELPETIDTAHADKDSYLQDLYNTMTSTLDKPLPYEKWKELYGHYIDPYNPAQEELEQEAFDIKVSQTNDLFKLKTEQENRTYDLITKYSEINDSDDFESSTEMAIRHSEESEILNTKLNRHNLIVEGLNLTGKIKEQEHKLALKNLRSGDVDALTDSLNESFWNSMGTIRANYDKQRLKKNQSLDKLLLKAEHTIDSAFASKEDSIKTTLINAQNNMQSAAVDLLQNKLDRREEYDDEVWDTLGNLAKNEAFEAECLYSSDCGTNERCINNHCTHYEGCDGIGGQKDECGVCNGPGPTVSCDDQVMNDCTTVCFGLGQGCQTECFNATSSQAMACSESDCQQPASFDVSQYVINNEENILTEAGCECGGTIENPGDIGGIIVNCKEPCDDSGSYEEQYNPCVQRILASGQCVCQDSFNNSCTGCGCPEPSSEPCFSENSTVELENKKIINIKDLSIGDKIKTINSKGKVEYSKVYAWLHKSDDKADYLSINTIGAYKALEISSNHLLNVNGSYRKAKTVKIGDIVSGNKVLSIDNVTVNGEYTPVTENGRIIVDGIDCSCYAIYSHAFSHFMVSMILKPLCKLMPSIIPTWLNKKGINKVAVITSRLIGNRAGI